MGKLAISTFIMVYFMWAVPTGNFFSININSDVKKCLKKLQGSGYNDCCLVPLCQSGQLNSTFSLEPAGNKCNDDHMAKLVQTCSHIHEISLPSKVLVGRGASATSISPKQSRVKYPNNDNATERISSGLQFLDVPRGDDLTIHELQRQNDFLLPEALADLMGYLLSSEIPIEELHELFRNRQSPYLWILQVLKLEIMAVVWIIFWAILSLCLPVGVTASFCIPTNIRHLNGDFRHDSLDNPARWTETTLGCLLQVMLLLLLCPIILILAANERVSKSIGTAPASAALVYDNLDTFVSNSQMQISFVATSSINVTIESVENDLKDIERLLGKPYQQLLSSKTGLEQELDGLDNLKENTKRVASMVAELLVDCETAQQASKAAQLEIREVARQLFAIQKQCGAKDKPLCFTIQFSGFDVSLPLTNITNDSGIGQLNKMNRDKALNLSVDTARSTYSNIPNQVLQDSTLYVTDIKSALSRRRAKVHDATSDLDVLSGTLSQELDVGRKAIVAVLEDVVKWDLWRWLAVLVNASILALIWGIWICAAPCGCGTTSKTRPLLIAGLVLSCFICIFIWMQGTLSFLLGGHGQSLICRSLYDHPNYQVLTELLDPGGVIYDEGGLFSDFSRSNDSLKVSDVLNNCQRDRPAYYTFHLYNTIDLNRTLDYNAWTDLKGAFDNFTTSKCRFEILDSSLEANLQLLLLSTVSNLTRYRQELSSSVTRRDFGSFADQLNIIGRQLSDPVVSRKVDNLAFSVRKVVQNEMRSLNDLRGRILYKITALEVLLPPLNRQVNQSLSNLKTIQLFLDNQAGRMSQKARRQFIDRIEDYLEGLYEHVSLKVTEEIGKCRPLWEIFHATRFHLCKLISQPLSIIAFLSFFVLFILITITPVIIKLIEIYKATPAADYPFGSHRNSRTGLMVEEEPMAWASPSSGSLGSMGDVPRTWLSPPSRLPTVSSRILSARVPDPTNLPSGGFSPKRRRNLAYRIPSTSKARTPRRQETMTLIETIHWKSGSTTPRSWI